MPRRDRLADPPLRLLNTGQAGPQEGRRRFQHIMKKTPTQSQKRSFRKAILAGDIDKVRAMLAAGMGPDTPYDGVAPLFLAAQGAEPDLVDVLVGTGADPNSSTQGQAGAYHWLRTPLNAAAGADVPRYECVERLLDYGANPCLVDDSGRNAAHVLLANATFNQIIDEMPRVNGILKRMLDLGVPPNNADSENRTLLHCAAISYGEPAGVQLLLERGADPLAEDSGGWSALDRACLHGRAAAAELLIRAGADPNRPSPTSPLLHMVYDIATLDVLLAAGADPGTRGPNGQTALAETLSGWKWADWPDKPESPTKALRLIAAGASLDTPDEKGVTPRQIVTRDGIPEILEAEKARDIGATGKRSKSLARNLAAPLQVPAPVQAPAPVKKATAGDRRALQQAIVRGDIGKLREMLENGVPADVAHGGVPPLFLAAQRGKPPMIDMLVQAGADPNRVLIGRASDQGPIRTALNAAARRPCLESIERLLDHGADPSVLDDEGRNAAHLLLRAADGPWLDGLLPQLYKTLARMLDSGVAVDAADPSGETLLHYAVRHRLPVEGLTLLIERGADPLRPDNDGGTPLHALHYWPNPGAVSLLVGLGADVNQYMPIGITLLHWVMTEENLEALLAARPDLEAKDQKGRTALYCALDQWKYSNYPDEPLYPWKAIRLIAAGASLDTPNNEGVTPRDIIARDGIPDVLGFAAKSDACLAMSRDTSTAHHREKD